MDVTADQQADYEAETGEDTLMNGETKDVDPMMDDDSMMDEGGLFDEGGRRRLSFVN